MPRGYGNDPQDISPANNLAAITPNDDDELAAWTRGIYVGGAGDVSVIAAEDSDAVVFVAVPVGTILPVKAKKVMEATTATNLVALY